MWEITIKTSLNNCDNLDYINNMLLTHFNNKVIIGRFSGDVCAMSVATKKQNSKAVWDYLRKLLCDVYCTQYKASFLQQNISFLPQNSPYFNAFIKVYTYFDLELEHSIAYRLIKYMPVIFLESFFIFRLGCLKQKWQDLCDITNNNSSAFLSSDTFISLLKFLISNLDKKTDSVIVSVKDNCFTYINKQNRQVIVGIKSEMETICSLIELSPIKIVLYGTQHTPLEQMISQLFDNCIVCQKN